MSCRDTIHLICWYLEGRLSQAVETEIRHHLENCSDCHLVLNAAVIGFGGNPAGCCCAARLIGAARATMRKRETFICTS